MGILEPNEEDRVGDGLPDVAPPSAAPDKPLFDLDMNDIPESNISAVYRAPSDTTYIEVTSATLGDFELELTKGQATVASDARAYAIEPLGKHFGGALQAVSVYFTTPKGSSLYPGLYVIDMNKKALVAYTRPPVDYTYYDTWSELATEASTGKATRLASCPSSRSTRTGLSFITARSRSRDARR